MDKTFEQPGLLATKARSRRAEKRVQIAEARSKLAETRTEQAKHRAESAETRTEKAETRTEFAKKRAKNAEIRTEHAESRTEHAEIRTEQAETRAEQAEARAEHCECILKRLIHNEASIPPPELTPAHGIADQRGLARLTSRQREVLQLIARGYNTKQIGDRLEVSPKTIEYHRLKLMGALKVHDIPGLVRFALRLGLIPPEG